MTLDDRRAADEVVRRIEEIRTARAEGWITLHVSREGRPVSVETRKVEALQLGTCN